jgi:hypothetical protein
MQLSHRLGPFMATDSMIVQGDVDDEIYENVVPDGMFDDQDAMHVLAALRAIDEHYKVQQDDDRAVLRGMYLSMTLMPYVRVVSPAKLVEYDKMQTDPNNETELTEAQEDEFESLLTQWFEICFDKEELDEYGITYPENLKGKTITIRALTEEEATELDANFATVRADGQQIGIPGISRHQF